MEIDKEETYVLPDGSIITIDDERFRCAEVLFQPFSRIHGTSFQNNMKCDGDIRNEVSANVVPSGGTAIFQGIAERMTNELTGSIHDEIKVVAPIRYELEDLVNELPDATLLSRAT